jgi:hypothetical protein
MHVMPYCNSTAVDAMIFSNANNGTVHIRPSTSCCHSNLSWVWIITSQHYGGTYKKALLQDSEWNYISENNCSGHSNKNVNIASSSQQSISCDE